MSDFADLQLRVLSAAAMALIGMLAVWLGGAAFLILLSLAGGLMILELAWMLGPRLGALKSGLLALIAAAAVLRVGYQPGWLPMISLLIAPVLGLVLLEKDRGLFLAYGAAILLAVSALFWIRTSAGFGWTLWLILVVVATDIGGYFFGRILGGPKILPRISPKKTWSGTLGGWLLAALTGAGFAVFWGGGAAWLVPFSIITAAASQLGDVAESAIKRHAGVKDSSNLIPGHGGFLDRFDALIAAALLAGLVFGLFAPPFAGAA